MFNLLAGSHSSFVSRSSAGATPTRASVAGKLHSLVYVSTAVDKLSKESLSRLVEEASARNGTLGVTGLLLYSDGNFMQCLEGSKESIDLLMKSIRSDHRHFGIFVILEDEISNREFAVWAMGVRSPDADLREMAGSQPIDVWLNTRVDEQKKSVSRVLLEDFWQRADEPNCNHRGQVWRRFEQANGKLSPTANTLGANYLEETGFQLQRRNAMEGAILDSLSAHIAVVDPSGNIVQVNGAWRRFGTSNSPPNGAQNSIGVNYLEVCNRSSQAGDPTARTAAEGVKSVLRGELPSFQFEYPCHSPTQERWFRMNVTPVAGDIGGAVVSHEDITAIRLKEAALRASEARRKLATDSGRVAIWESDLKTKQLFLDESCFTLYQIRKEEFKGTFEEWSRTIHPQDLDSVIQAFQAAVAGTRECDLTFRIVWPNGEVRHIEAHGKVLRNGDGVAERIMGTHWDITAQKRQEEALQSSVREKSALLNEVHHRVKNNLQVITSLLRLESRRSTVDVTKEVLGDMHARIRAMALLHESLCRSGTLASVDLGCYLRQLTTQAFQTRSTNSGTVQLLLNLGSVQVDIDQAISCGLLINELLSNCLKHGFPPSVMGHVSVELQPLDAPNQWRLCVCDTGVGLPEDFEKKRTASLGLLLAGDLARQIGGELMMTPNQGKGVSFAVSFQAPELSPLVKPA